MSADLLDKPINQLTSSLKPVEYLFMCVKSAADTDLSSC